MCTQYSLLKYIKPPPNKSEGKMYNSYVHKFYFLSLQVEILLNPSAKPQLNLKVSYKQLTHPPLNSH